MPRNDLSFKMFNGKSYSHAGFRKTKAAAQKLAKELRNLGMKARVVPVVHSKGSWGVYSR